MNPIQKIKQNKIINLTTNEEYLEILININKEIQEYIGKLK